MDEETSFGELDHDLIEPTWPLECALRLEDQLYKLFSHGKPYNEKVRSLLFNLQDKKNPNARKALLT